MKRVLMVGCGGAGGATLQFVMDQLRADLAAAQISSIPAGWQFVHLDVPGSPDQVAPGMPPSVPAMGGRYVSLGTSTARYDDVARTVDAKLVEQRALSTSATWAADPSRVVIPVDRGAGQYRALGRYLTMSKAKKVDEALRAAWGDLQSQDARLALEDVARKLSPATVGQVNDLPNVIIVSSMAGGSGASMALDVCRIMSAIPGAITSLFLYTPEVFYQLPDSLRSGVEANAAAMLGELVAAQSDPSSDEDRRVLRALGVDLGEPVAPFRRVIPIGARVGGDGQVFGDGSQAGVYRGIGRGLAALVSSGVAMQRYQQQVIENVSGDIPNRTRFGWGVGHDRLVWGAFGFSSVDLGRDRYAEYSAQRIARAAIDRLVTGHRTQGDPRPSAEQLDTLTDQVLWPRLLHRLPVPPDRGTQPWVQGLVAGWQADRAMDAFVDELVSRRIESSPEMEGSQWATTLTAYGAQSRDELGRRLDDATYRWTYQWAQAFQDELIALVVEISATYGLPAAREVLGRLRRAIDGWTAELRGAPAPPRDLGAPHSDEGGRLATIRGRLTAASEPVRAFLEGLRTTMRWAARSRVCQLMAEVLPTLSAGLITPLEEALGEGLRVLERQREDKPSLQGMALLRTNTYQSWPQAADGPVPPRFFEAHNEVLLTSAADYPAQFGPHVVAAQPRRAGQEGNQGFVPAYAAIVTAVLQGEWTTEGGERSRFESIETAARWRSRVFQVDPDDPSRLPQVPRPGQYKLLLDCVSVLDRARAYVGRPGAAFHQFVGQSIRDYLQDTAVGATERADRAQTLRGAFLEALDLARPLVAVNRETVHTVHGTVPTNYFTFSAIPVGGLPLEAQLAERMAGEDMNAATSESFRAAVEAGGGNQRVSRIDIFGAHPCYSPVTYTSVLRPVWQRWTASNESQRTEFWRWRRSRRLAAGLPVGAEERRALVGGWFLGRAFGLVRFPGEAHSPGFAVYDRAARSWVAFPEQLLTPVSRQRHPFDRVAAVLESLPLAIAACSNSSSLAPLEAYQVLRSLWDDGREDPSVRQLDESEIWGSPHHLVSRQRVIQEWLASGTSPGATLPPAALAGTPEMTPEERRDALLKAFTDLRTRVGRDLLPPGHHGAPGGGPFSVIEQPATLLTVPLAHELGEDLFLAASELVTLVETAQLHKGPGNDDVSGEF